MLFTFKKNISSFWMSNSPLYCVQTLRCYNYSTINCQTEGLINFYSLREAAKKSSIIMARPLRGGGFKALMTLPLVEELFFAASLYLSGFYIRWLIRKSGAIMYARPTYNRLCPF